MGVIPGVGRDPADNSLNDLNRIEKMGKIKGKAFNWYMSDRFKALNFWLTAVQKTQEERTPTLVSDARYAHLGNLSEPIQPMVDWTDRLKQETVLGDRRKVVRAFFTPATRGEIQEITSDSEIPVQILERAIILKRDCLGGERFSSTPLFNAIAEMDNNGFAIAFSNTYLKNRDRGLRSGIRVCRVSNQLPDGIRVIGRYAADRESLVLEGM